MEQAHLRDDRRTRRCLDCRYRNVPWATACSVCGAAMRHAPPGERRAYAPATEVESPGPGWPLVMGLGAFFAPALALLPILQYVGWFLASLVHEIGHCIAAWLFGAPAYPAIRIDGHAAAMHGEQRTVIVIAVFLGLLWLTWRCRRRPVLRIVCGLAVLLHPLLAFTTAHDPIHLLAGHLGELAFAGVFFYRALSGGFTDSVPERITYACVAWFLLGRNVVMDFGLVTSAAARAAYAGNGSFGLTQDFVRASRELGWSLGDVGALMLGVSLLTLPVAAYVWHRLERAHAAR